MSSCEKSRIYIIALEVFLAASLINGQALPTISNTTMKAIVAKPAGVKKIDIVLLVETVKISSQSYNCAIEALLNIVYVFEGNPVPISASAINIGIIKFDEYATVMLRLAAGNTGQKIQAVLQSIKQYGNVSRLDRAFGLARNMFVSGGRLGATRKLIAITSQKQSVNPIPIATVLRSLGVEIFMLPATSRVNRTVIEKIASLPLNRHIGNSPINFCQLANVVSKYKK